jgi:hypothetical protein
MSTKTKVLLGLSAIFAVSLFSIPEASYAWWLSTGYVLVHRDQDECMRRAAATLQHELKGEGQMTRSRDTVQRSGQNAAIIIHCVSCGHENSVAFIAVTADPSRAKRLRDVVFDKIKSGGPYE